jgi:hypothetical protein
MRLNAPLPCVALLATLALAGSAFAQTQVPPPPSALEPSSGMSSLAQLDTNKDGFVDKSEVPSGNELAGKFARLDTNSDGKLDPAEFARYQEEKR